MSRRRKGNKKCGNDERIISIPVYITDPLPVLKKGDCFFPYTQETMIEQAKCDIETFNSSSNNHNILSNMSSSTTEYGIDYIDVYDLVFAQDPCLLLKVSAYQTNLIDGYLINESNTNEHFFKPKDKICSNTYYMLLYPRIYSNLFVGKNAAYWNVFLYVDPSKENKDMSRIAKHIMSRIIKAPIRNVKSEKFLADIRASKRFKEVQIKICTFSEGEDDEPEYITRYDYKSSIKKDKVITMTNVNAEDAILALEDTTHYPNNCRRSIRLETLDQRVFSAVQIFQEKLSQTFEDSFNYTFTVPLVDIKTKKIFEIDYIKSKIQGLITRYMINNSYDE